MKKYFLLLKVVVIFNYFIFKALAENDYYVISLERKPNDIEFKKANSKIKNEIYEMVNDNMNDIYEIIDNYKNSYKTGSGELDEKLKELEITSKLRKRSELESNKKFKFINNNFFKNNIEQSINDRNSKNNDYILFESDLVKHAFPILNTYVIYAYLNEEVAKIVEKLPNVAYCEKNKISIENNVIPTVESSNKYYNIEEIINETHWKNVTVQENIIDNNFKYTHLSILSQGRYYKNSESVYDNNYYYPSSAGEGIDIYIIDSGLDFEVSKDEFDNTDERTVTIDARCENFDLFPIPESERNKTYYSKRFDVPLHGTHVAVAAGGKLNGVAKKANIHIIATELYVSDDINALKYIYTVASKKADKSVINISLSHIGFTSSIQNLITEMVNDGFIIIVAAGNDRNNCFSNDIFYAGYNGVISVGAIGQKYTSDIWEIYKKASYSNFGKCVNIFAPGTIKYTNSKTKKQIIESGTSISSPIAVGMAATLMSENPDIKYNYETMKEKLIELSLKDVIEELDQDTPNLLLNNGKKSLINIPRCDDPSGKYHCNEKCCTKNGTCDEPSMDPNDYFSLCYVENGCLDEFGYCSSRYCNHKNTIRPCSEDQYCNIYTCSSIYPNNYIDIYIYNANKNKCLRTTGLPETSLTYGACDNSNSTVWTVPYSSTHYGIFRSKVNSDYCINIEEGVVSLKKCNTNSMLKSNGNFIKSIYSDNYCIGSSNNDPNEISLKECDAHDLDQIWYFNDWIPNPDVNEEPPVVSQPETVTVYLYNAYKNKCIHNNATTGNCDFNDDSLWEVPVTHHGYYRSKADPEKCLSIIDGVVSLSECNENTILYRDGNFIKSPLSDDHCIISSKDDDTLKYIEGCDVNDSNDIWYINIWTPSQVENPEPSTTETPVPTTINEPGTVTVYLYNAYKNKCIHNNATTGNCDFNDDSLWEVPATHYGYYRSKADPEKCLSIIDGAISLSECNENTILYRDGNFIKSPLSDDHCIVSSKNEDTLELEGCDINDSNQIWYINIWTPSSVENPEPSTTEAPVPTTINEPETVTVYLYNAYKNKCIHNNATTGNCDFNDDSLWEVPATHYGYYRSKADPEKCLSIIDGAISLSECNENTILYRDGNFIKSPLSDDHCIVSSKNEDTLELEGCDINDSNQIWYINIWTPSSVENPEPSTTEAPVPTTINEPETVTVYLYNAYKNKCIHNNATTGNCDFNDDSLWEVPATHYGYYRSKADPEKCLSIIDGAISLSECNENTILYRDGNFIKSPLSDDHCIVSAKDDDTLKYIEGCDINDPNDIWYINIWIPSQVENPEPSTTETPVPTTINEPETVTVYLYNAYKNKCIHNNATTGNCDFNDDSLWEVPATHYGYYRSKADPEKCLSIIDGAISLSECNENTILYRDGNFIKSPLSDDYCIVSAKDEDSLELEGCDINDSNHIWYINILTPSSIENPEPSMTEAPVPTTINEPGTVTVYLYNAFKNKCIHNNATIGNCDFNDDSLWEVPATHYGYYRSKADPKKCLSITDSAISLSECNENTILYRDGNFIKSPLSDDHCIVSAKDEDSLELEGCDINDSNHIWYINIWTP